MKCSTHSAIFSLMAIAFAVLGTGTTSATPITLNLNPALSSITISALFGGAPASAQEGVAGTTDLVAGSPSTRTTFQGTITVDVDNVLSPSTIKIVSSAADADTSGNWYAQIRPYQDLNGNGDPGEFGLPPDGDSETATNGNFGPAAAADWGIRVFNPAFGVNVAFGGYRGIFYNIDSGVEPVVAGQFSSLTEHIEPDGFLDYWVAPGAGALLGRTEANTGDTYTNTAGVSSYTVVPLGGGANQVTLTIPVLIDDMGSTLRTTYTGQFVATLVISIPEPASATLFGLGGILAVFVRKRNRRNEFGFIRDRACNLPRKRS
jgi:hypothetical protein